MDNELAAFSRTCNVALTLAQRGTPGAGSMSLTDLTAHSDDLRNQWQEKKKAAGKEDTSLGSQIPGLGARMAQYSAYDLALRTMHGEPVGVAGALANAEQMREAANLSQRASGGAQGALADHLSEFRKLCEHVRSELLLKAVQMQFKEVEATHAELGKPAKPALWRSEDIAMAYDVLLAGAPLPDEKIQTKSEAPGPQAGPAQEIFVMDQALIERTREVAATALALRKKHAKAIALPADAPRQARHELEAGLTVLGQTELTLRTAHETISRFHDLATALGPAEPAAAEPHAVARERLATVQHHAEAMKKLAKELRQAMQAQVNLVTQASPQWVRDRVERSNMRLRADHRHAERTQVALETLEQLQLLRGSALTILDEFRQGKLDRLARPEVLGKEHASLLARLDRDMKPIRQRLLSEEDVMAPEAVMDEMSRHDRCAAALKTRVNTDQALMQSQLLLAWAAKAREQNSGRLPPAAMPLLAPLLTLLSKKLVNINKDLAAHAAAASEHKDRYDAQIALNRKVLGEVRLQEDLMRMQDSSSSSRSDEPAAPPAGSAPAAAEARQATQTGRSSGRPRHARRR